MEKQIFKFNEVNIPYQIYTYYINNTLFRTTFVFYTNDIPITYYIYLKDIINEFSRSIFYNSKYFKNYIFDSIFNNEIIIVYDDKFDIKKSIELENDFNYIQKKFVKNSNNLKFEDKSIVFSSNFVNINFNKEEVTQNLLIKRFNLISGLCGSGKSMYLKLIANLFKSDVYDVINVVYDNNKKLGSSEKVLYEIDKILFSELNNYENFLLLIDNIPWHLLDNKSKISVIDKLFEFSVNKRPIYITSVDNDIKVLVKKRTYNPNFINL